MIKKDKRVISTCSVNLYSKEEYDEFDLRNFLGRLLTRDKDNIKNIKLTTFEKGSVKITLEIDTNDLEGLFLSLKLSGLLSNHLKNFNITKVNSEPDDRNSVKNNSYSKLQLKEAFLLPEQFEFALEKLEEKINMAHPSQINTFLVIKANYYDFRNKMITGTESHDVLTREKNKITIAILNFIDSNL